MIKFIKLIFQRIDNMLMSDIGKNKWSSNRVTFVSTVTISNVIFWCTLLVLSLKNGNFPEIPDALIYIYGMANGFAFTGKVAQHASEVKKTVSDNGVKIEQVKNGKLPHDLDESPEGVPPPPEE